MMQRAITKYSEKVIDVAGRTVYCLKDRYSLRIADDCHCSVHTVYIEALKQGIYPFRYIRNRDIISLQEQLKLAESAVAVIGAGGLGGQAIVLLARLGIGQLIVADYDVFDETNLNRQALCTIDTLEKPKAAVGSDVVALINPGVEITAHRFKLGDGNIEEVISDVDVVIDALDTVRGRNTVENAVRRLSIPMVHGAVAGFEGHVMTIFPDDRGLAMLYGETDDSNDTATRPEAVLGVPAIAPSVIAAYQVMEVFKILLSRGRVFRNMMVHIDLEYGRMEEFTFPEEEHNA